MAGNPATNLVFMHYCTGTYADCAGDDERAVLARFAQEPCILLTRQ